MGAFTGLSKFLPRIFVKKTAEARRSRRFTRKNPNNPSVSSGQSRAIRSFFSVDPFVKPVREGYLASYARSNPIFHCILQFMLDNLIFGEKNIDEKACLDIDGFYCSFSIWIGSKRSGFC